MHNVVREIVNGALSEEEVTSMSKQDVDLFLFLVSRSGVDFAVNVHRNTN
jgi:hypothetical protein